MAAAEYSHRVKRVLKSYQSSAVKGLHGPSVYYNAAATTAVEYSGYSSTTSPVTSSTAVTSYKDCPMLVKSYKGCNDSSNSLGTKGGITKSSNSGSMQQVHGYKKILHRQALQQAAEAAAAAKCCNDEQQPGAMKRGMEEDDLPLYQYNKLLPQHTTSTNTKKIYDIQDHRLLLDCSSSACNTTIDGTTKHLYHVQQSYGSNRTTSCSAATTTTMSGGGKYHNRCCGNSDDLVVLKTSSGCSGGNTATRTSGDMKYECGDVVDDGRSGECCGDGRSGECCGDGRSGECCGDGRSGECCGDGSGECCGDGRSGEPYFIASTTRPPLNNTWTDAGAVSPPSPYSPSVGGGYTSPSHAPFPLVMGSADESCIKEEVLLEGERIACFSVGGEKRLCFIQVLSYPLRSFYITQINSKIAELQIFFSLCSNRQLQALKYDGDIPANTKSCGLITYSDAHRLTHALLHANAPAADPPKAVTLPYNSSTRQFANVSSLAKQQAAANASKSTNHLLPNIMVSHRCFGKCRGWVYLQLYTHAESKCIQCVECGAFYTTGQFVSHAHKALENMTCHWGFDPSNWRQYLQLASDQPLQPTDSTAPLLPEVYLEQLKNKFDPNSPANKKYKQVECLTRRDHHRQDLLHPPSCGREDTPSHAPARDSHSSGGALGPSQKLVVVNEAPPVLADPNHVVPLSQYQNYRNCQPNITLAPPNQRGTTAILLDDAAVVQVKTEPQQQPLRISKASSSSSTSTAEHKSKTAAPGEPGGGGQVYTLYPVKDPSSYDSKVYAAKNSSVGSKDLQVITLDRPSFLSINDCQLRFESRSFKNLQVLSDSPMLPKDLKIIKLGSLSEDRDNRRRHSVDHSGTINRQREYSPGATVKRELPEDDQQHFTVVKEETDLDTMVVADTPHSSITEEADTLLSSWSDKASASKVRQIIQSLVSRTKEEPLAAEDGEDECGGGGGGELRAARFKDTRESSGGGTLKRAHQENDISQSSLDAEISALESKLLRLRSQRAASKRIKTEPPDGGGTSQTEDEQQQMDEGTQEQRSSGGDKSCSSSSSNSSSSNLQKPSNSSRRSSESEGSNERRDSSRSEGSRGVKSDDGNTGRSSSHLHHHKDKSRHRKRKEENESRRSKEQQLRKQTIRQLHEKTEQMEDEGEENSFTPKPGESSRPSKSENEKEVSSADKKSSACDNKDVKEVMKTT